MNFNQLKYIIAIDKHRNFSKAADECEVAQSTLSKEVQRLEKEFNILIFDRSRHPVVPTLKGIDLLEKAKDILSEYHEFTAIAIKKDNIPAGNYRLGIIPELAPYLLPLFSTTFSKKYPELNLNISEHNEKEIEEAFTQETLDAALTVAPFFKSGYYEDVLFQEDFVLYLNEKHKLAQEKEVRWKDIPWEELILQNGIKSFLFDLQKDHSFLYSSSQKLQNIAYENGSLETIRKIIDLNGGLTLLPHLSTLYMGPRRLKMVREIKSPTPTRNIILVTPRGFEKNRITKVLRKEILASLPPKQN